MNMARDVWEQQEKESDREERATSSGRASRRHRRPHFPRHRALSLSLSLNLRCVGPASRRLSGDVPSPPLDVRRPSTSAPSKFRTRRARLAPVAVASDLPSLPGFVGFFSFFFVCLFVFFSVTNLDPILRGPYGPSYRVLVWFLRGLSIFYRSLKGLAELEKSLLGGTGFDSIGSNIDIILCS